MWELLTKGFRAVAAGNAQAKLGFQSPHLPGAMVRVGRFLYTTSLGWIAVTWYSGFVNMRTQPGTGPTLVLPGKPIINTPDRPNRKLPAGMARGGGGGSGTPSTPLGQAPAGPLTSAFQGLAGNIGQAIGGAASAPSRAYPGTPGRTDMGVDFGAVGPVRALGDGHILSVGLWPGWPGHGGLVYQMPGYPPVYIMETFTPARGLKPGDRITKGQILGQAEGGRTGIESGWANAQGTAPLTPYAGKPDGTPMPGGLAFRKLLGYAN